MLMMNLSLWAAAAAMTVAAPAPLMPAALTSVSSGLVQEHDEDDFYASVYDVRGLYTLLDDGETDAGETLDSLLSRLGGASGIAYEPILFDSVFLVEGDGSNHAAFRGYLAQVEQLYSRRFEVDVICYTAASNSAPQIGNAAMDRASGDVLFRARQVVINGQRTSFASTTEHSYVSDVTPVVGTQSVGYDVEVATLEEGVDLGITVGPAPGRSSAVEVRVNGRVQTVEIEARQNESMVDLPRVTERAVTSSLVMDAQAPTVVAVVNGLHEAECIVITVNVRELK
ncbi:MAG: hypothetical protein KDA21_09850 [Phycisphaerales bacterium]|nr:hypothetical protein [Phycisphaerales bacterium]